MRASEVGRFAEADDLWAIQNHLSGHFVVDPPGDGLRLGLPWAELRLHIGGGPTATVISPSWAFLAGKLRSLA